MFRRAAETQQCGPPKKRQKCSPSGVATLDLASRLASCLARNAAALAQFAGACKACRSGADAVQGTQRVCHRITLVHNPACPAPPAEDGAPDVLVRVCRRASVSVTLHVRSSGVTAEAVNTALRSLHQARYVSLCLGRVACDLALLKGVPRLHLQESEALSDLRPLTGVRWLKIKQCPNVKRLPKVARGATVIVDCEFDANNSLETLEGLELAHSVDIKFRAPEEEDRVCLEPLAKVHRVSLTNDGFRDFSPLRNAFEVSLANVTLCHGKYDFANVHALQLQECHTGNEDDEDDEDPPLDVGNVVALHIQACSGILGMRVPPSLQRLSVWATECDEPDLEAPVCASWVALRGVRQTGINGLKNVDHLILVDFDKDDIDLLSGLDGGSIRKVELWGVKFVDVAPLASAEHVVIDHCRGLRNLEALNKVPTVEVIGAQFLHQPQKKLDRAVTVTTNHRWDPYHDMPVAHDFWDARHD